MQRAVSRYFISRTLGPWALALLLPAFIPAHIVLGQGLIPTPAQVQGEPARPRPGKAVFSPDPVSYGNRLEQGDVSQVRAWLNAGMHPDFLADRVGTGLMVAAWHGHLPIMELLVASGADVNKSNALGEQALMHAAWRGQTEAIKWLLAKGARINNGTMRWSALHYAAFSGQAKATAMLLDNGADINARSTNGSSPLMMAVYEGHEDMVKQLLARGADRSVKNDRGDGALEWAFKFQRLGIARLVSAPQEFVAAANQPKSRWGAPLRSLSEGEAITDPPRAEAAPDPASEKIDELMRLRETLASRGLNAAVKRLDTRIATLRAQRARADRSTPAAVLEISASRAAPESQRMRMIFGADGPPP
jgi:ankyrin repeat protein